FLIFFFSVLSMDNINYALAFTPVNIFFYLLIIYGNISFLFPVFWQKDKKAFYVVFTIILLVVAGMARGYIITKINNQFYPKEHEQFTVLAMLYYVLTGVLTYTL